MRGGVAMRWLAVLCLGVGLAGVATADMREADIQARLRAARERLSPESQEGPATSEPPAVEHNEPLARFLQTPLSVLNLHETVAIGTVTLEADSLTHEGEGRFRARGHVRLHYRDTTVEANELTFNEPVGEIQVTGRVTLRRGDAVLRTRDVRLNLKSELGTLGATHLYLEGRHYYVDADHLEKVGPTHYDVAGGRFSACVPTNRTWEFRAKQMSVDTAGKLKAHHVLFYWRSVPILYLPYLEQDISTPRTSGLLLSQPETSSRYGFTLDNAYYWVINNSMDATARFDIKGSQGFGVGGEFRYAAGPESEGEIKAYRLQDTSGVSYEAHADIRHQITDRTRARLNLHYIDETDAESLRGFSSSTATRVTRNLVSDAFISQRAENMVGTVNLRLFQDLVDHAGTQFQRLPDLRLEMPLRPVFSQRLLWRNAVHATNFWRDQGSHGWRIDLNSALRRDLSPQPGIDLYGEAGMEEALYTFSEIEEDRDNHNRTLLHTRLGTRGRLYRSYGDLDHVVEPRLEYFGRIGETPENVPQIDRIDRHARASQIDLLLTQHLRDHATGFPLATLRTGTGVNLRNADLDARDESIDTFGELTLRSPAGLAFDLESHWHTDPGSHRVSGMNLSYIKDRNWFLRGGVRWLATNHQFATAAGGIRLSPRWALATEQWFDLNDGELSESSFSIDRTSQCYGQTLELHYFQRATDGTTSSGEYRVLAKLRLLNVGSIATPSLALERSTSTIDRSAAPTSAVPPAGSSALDTNRSVDPSQVIRGWVRGSFL
ncbi:MAG: hypothetical protein COZ96_11580 [Nitrospirae bacterium CG_4_8_14_3_um_filter_70_85]|nr:MAG: hypothetical protein COZ96_11580 [Nitrospirae bacterium CG_4_8_14_3_um_filter_70_85]